MMYKWGVCPLKMDNPFDEANTEYLFIKQAFHYSRHMGPNKQPLLLKSLTSDKNNYT